ncbi:helix-turn-helix domain-containing protein [Bacillus cereus]|uniref:helix-turn-helix domain-containing protein n=1 Tax=Bacillus cereus TaxID=1396 RepID=UPI00362D259F
MPIVADQFDALTWLSALGCHGPKTQRVAIALFTHADNSKRTAHPSLETLMAETGLNRRNVQRQIEKLEAENWVSRVQRGRSGWATQYVLTLPNPLPWLAPERKSAAPHPENCKCKVCFECRCAFCRTHGQTAARPDTAIESGEDTSPDTRSDYQSGVDPGRRIRPRTVAHSPAKVAHSPAQGGASAAPTSFRTSSQNSSKEDSSLSGSNASRSDRDRAATDDSDLVRHGERTEMSYPLPDDFAGNDSLRALLDHDETDYAEFLERFASDYRAGRINQQTSTNWGGVADQYIRATYFDTAEHHVQRRFDEAVAALDIEPDCCDHDAEPLDEPDTTAHHDTNEVVMTELTDDDRRRAAQIAWCRAQLPRSPASAPIRKASAATPAYDADVTNPPFDFPEEVFA